MPGYSPKSKIFKDQTLCPSAYRPPLLLTLRVIVVPLLGFGCYAILKRQRRKMTAITAKIFVATLPKKSCANFSTVTTLEKYKRSAQSMDASINKQKHFTQTRSSM